MRPQDNQATSIVGCIRCPSSSQWKRLKAWSCRKLQAPCFCKTQVKPQACQHSVVMNTSKAPVSSAVMTETWKHYLHCSLRACCWHTSSTSPHNIILSLDALVFVMCGRHGRNADACLQHNRCGLDQAPAGGLLSTLKSGTDQTRKLKRATTWILKAVPKISPGDTISSMLCSHLHAPLWPKNFAQCHNVIKPDDGQTSTKTTLACLCILHPVICAGCSI